MALSKHKATIGRKLWFWNGEGENSKDEKQAFNADVIFVNPNNTVNLAVIDHDGVTTMYEDVELHDPSPDDCHGNGEEGTFDYATWMPYQKTLMDSQQGSQDAKKEN